jgi:hypothetical protein
MLGVRRGDRVGNVVPVPHPRHAHQLADFSYGQVRPLAAVRPEGRLPPVLAGVAEDADRVSIGAGAPG